MLADSSFSECLGQRLKARSVELAPSSRPQKALFLGRVKVQTHSVHC